MKNKHTKTANWANEFRTHLLDSITWGKLVYIAVLFATSLFVYLSIKAK